jgi:dihydroxyacetone kinase-like protein
MTSMESFPGSKGSLILRSLVQTIQDNAALLSELDGAIGDGDHGVNMKKGFTLAAGRIGDKTDLAAGLEILGETLLTEIGGAMGPLYGTFFTEMAGAANAPQIDAVTFATMLDAGLSGVAELGGAQVGDKTMIDTLVPARDAYREALAAGADFSTALQRMAAAAELGSASTRHLVAKMGRASRLGERSRGSVDPGAASCALILTSLATSIESCLERSVGTA